jgi:hypothetical protein
VIVDSGFAEFALSWGRQDASWLTIFVDNGNDIITSTV